MRHRTLPTLAAIAATAALSLVAVACSDDPAGSADVPSATTTAGPATTVADAESAPDTTVAPTDDTSADALPVTFTVRPGPLQVTVLDATPGLEVELRQSESSIASGEVDEQGSLLFRGVDPGSGYRLYSDEGASDTFSVPDVNEVPDASFYADQELAAPGFGYLTVRDGTTLSANVLLPGPVEDGPYPTVVEYSGYSPSNPDDAALAQLYTGLGFAYVGVNMRGTGCSGGSYRFFEPVQSTDGYDVIEAVAAQPWVEDHRVGMVGISYPGISQLFVAATQPPSLEAITPLSVLDDAYRSTLYPGGILNTGFAVDWTQARLDQAEPFGQGWTKDRADAGDDECAANQRVRLQNPDLVAEIEANPYDSAELGDPLAPATFVDRIDVPVFLAGAWQDEQTGGHFATMLDRFTSAPQLYVTLTNGLHTESLAPPVMQRYVEFLQLYVAHETPSMAAINGAITVLTDALYGVTDVAPFDDRFAGDTYEEALAAFEAEPRVRVLLEQGAGGEVPGAPEPRSVAEFDAWPVPSAVATTWRLDDGGALVAAGSDATDVSTSGADDYTADPDALPDTFYDGSGDGIWRADVQYDWEPLPDGTGIGFVTEPLADDTTVIGSGSVDLWISADADDTDLEVTVSEVRPDGTEIYVQSGWLRASQRALDTAASTDLRPVQTHLEADAAPLVPGEVVPVRVELFPVAHPFRAGSRIRLTIDAPGNARGVWVFDTLSDGETVTVVHDDAHPSALVLPVVPDVDLASGAPPACGALRGQPCRAYEPAANGG
ncbi:MAG: CocE/NonD family hydrolase [Acidimicrobiales bacterium]